MGALDGKTALITGGTRGLGRAIAEAFLEAGVETLFILARNPIAVLETQAELTKCYPSSRVFMINCDVTEWQGFYDKYRRVFAHFGGVDILVNNAAQQGIWTVISPYRMLDIWERTMQVNLGAPFLMMLDLMTPMQEKGWGKIINISGGGATKPSPGLSAYAASKTAMVRLTETFAQELKGTGIDINAVAPGALNTLMQDEVIAAGPQIVGEQRYQEALKIKETGGDSLEEAAALCVWLASHASDGLSGKLISAKWDDWRHLDIPKVMASDWGTLRRVDHEK